MWAPFVALQMSSLYSASSHTQDSLYGATVSIAVQSLSFMCFRSLTFGIHNVLDVTLEEKNQEELNQGFWEAKV